jgi:hypothetical protein
MPAQSPKGSEFGSYGTTLTLIPARFIASSGPTCCGSRRPRLIKVKLAFNPDGWWPAPQLTRSYK